MNHFHPPTIFIHPLFHRVLTIFIIVVVSQMVHASGHFIESRVTDKADYDPELVTGRTECVGINLLESITDVSAVDDNCPSFIITKAIPLSGGGCQVCVQSNKVWFKEFYGETDCQAAQERSAAPEMKKSTDLLILPNPARDQVTLRLNSNFPAVHF